MWQLFESDNLVHLEYSACWIVFVAQRRNQHRVPELVADTQSHTSDNQRPRVPSNFFFTASPTHSFHSPHLQTTKIRTRRDDIETRRQMVTSYFYGYFLTQGDVDMLDLSCWKIRNYDGCSFHCYGEIQKNASRFSLTDRNHPVI